MSPDSLKTGGCILAVLIVCAVIPLHPVIMNKTRWPFRWLLPMIAITGLVTGPGCASQRMIDFYQSLWPLVSFALMSLGLASMLLSVMSFSDWLRSGQDVS